MTTKDLFSDLDEYYRRADTCISDDGVEIRMSLSPWGCSLKFIKEAPVDEMLLSKLNASDDFFYYAADEGKLIAKAGLFVDGRPTKSSLKLLLDIGLARFKSAEMLLERAGNEQH